MRERERERERSAQRVVIFIVTSVDRGKKKLTEGG